jgi:hypothetical protein
MRKSWRTGRCTIMKSRFLSISMPSKSDRNTEGRLVVGLFSRLRLRDPSKRTASAELHRRVEKFGFPAGARALLQADRLLSASATHGAGIHVTSRRTGRCATSCEASASGCGGGTERTKSRLRHFCRCRKAFAHNRLGARGPNLALKIKGYVLNGRLEIS